MTRPVEPQGLEWSFKSLDDADAVHEALLRDSKEIRCSDPDRSVQLMRLAYDLGAQIARCRPKRRVLGLFR